VHGLDKPGVFTTVSFFVLTMGYASKAIVEPDAVTDDFTGKAVILVTLIGGWSSHVWLPLLVCHAS
jgi:hypothetical protein